MGDKTGISWTDATWSPTIGCSRTIAAGATQSGCGDGTGGGCWAERMAGRFCGEGQPWHGFVRITANGPRWTGKVALAEDRLAIPLRWRRGRRIFVDSTADLFHERIADEQIDLVLAVMLLCPHHTFQVLTKRAARMRAYFTGPGLYERVLAAADRIRRERILRGRPRPMEIGISNPTTHPANWIWLGISAENQPALAERLPHLLATPAAVHFISAEPLLGPLNVARYLRWRVDGEALTARQLGGALTFCAGVACPSEAPCRTHGIDWVIAGCESGPGARPCDVEWLRSLRDQCAAAGTAFFLKQARPAPGSLATGLPKPRPIDSGPGSKWKPGGLLELPYLDGVQHAAMPTTKEHTAP